MLTDVRQVAEMGKLAVILFERHKGENSEKGEKVVRVQLC